MTDQSDTEFNAQQRHADERMGLNQNIKQNPDGTISPINPSKPSSFTTSPPDQPEDAALSDDQKRRSAIGKIVTSNLSPLGKLEAIDTLFMEQQAKAVQAARIDEAGSIVNISGEGYFHLNILENGDREYIPVSEYIEQLQAAQPPAADITKQGEGESDE